VLPFCLVAEEKLKSFDEDFHGIERKIDEKSKELTSAMEKLTAVEEEVKNLQTSIQNAQKEEKNSSKEIEELINQQSSAENENATEK
jgi:septal ring factor EnvC (AmiA/AmiB activator)